MQEVPLNVLTENLIISEKAVVERYLAERKFLLLIAAGDYDGVRQLLDSGPFTQESFMDFVVRNPNDPEQRIRDLALISNTAMRSTLLRTEVPVTLLHGLATYWGRIIRSAPIEEFEKGNLFDSMIRSYCELAREFNQKRYSPTVERIINYIFYHLSTPLTPKQIAEAFNYTSVYISRLLKKETGYSTVQYIKQKRISLAKTFLLLNDMSLEEIAIALGYEDYNYFCRVFKQVENMSPAQYRESISNDAKHKHP